MNQVVVVLLVHRKLVLVRFRRVHFVNGRIQKLIEGLAVLVRVEVELVQQVKELRVAIVVDKYVHGELVFVDQIEPLVAVVHAIHNHGPLNVLVTCVTDHSKHDIGVVGFHSTTQRLQ